MKFKNLLLTIMLSIAANISYADPYDNRGGDGMTNNGLQNSDLTQNQNTGIVPPSSTNIPISRDGETMDDEDY